MIAILQPLIPHYRDDFFKGLKEEFNLEIYCYNGFNKLEKDNFNQAQIKSKYLKNISIGPVLIFNPLNFIKHEYETLILMLHIGHISTWFLLLTKLFHKKKIILWGHGISVKRYLKEEKRPSFFLKTMICLSDGVWVYTEKEKEIWKKIFPKKKIISLNNTISNIDQILEVEVFNIEKLKNKYSITQETILIFCARFNEPARRVDLLLEVIEQLDTDNFGFIIIGEGSDKPNFSKYSNVYDFNGLYDQNIKNELFSISNIYFQPGWLGLSIVEAMAYGKPVFSFKRSKTIHQCVEYFYVIDGFNGKLFESVEECILSINNTSKEDLFVLGNNAKDFVNKNHRISNMVSNACSILQ